MENEREALIGNVFGVTETQKLRLSIVRDKVLTQSLRLLPLRKLHVSTKITRLESFVRFVKVSGVLYE